MQRGFEAIDSTEKMDSASAVLKVLHIAPTPFFADRGCHIRIRGLVCALNRLGIENVVCTYHHGRDVAGVETRRIGAIPKFTSTDAGPNRSKYLADLKLLILAVREIRRLRPDIVHGHLHEGALIGWLARVVAMRWRTPLVADIQGSLVGELRTFNYFSNSRWLYRVFWGIEYVILRLPKHLFCSSPTSKSLLLGDFRIAPQKVTQVDDAVDADIFARVRNTGTKPPLPSDTITVIYSGSLLPGKGVVELCEALRQLLAHRDDIRVLLIGYPVDTVHSLMGQAAQDERITLMGRVAYDDLPQHLVAADIALEPKNADSGEGSGKVIHYMAAGLPIVCFDTRNNRALMGDIGFYAKRGSIEEFVAQIELLADDVELRRRHGEAGAIQAKETLSWEQGGKLISAIYCKFARI